MPWVSFDADLLWSPAPLRGRWSKLYRKGEVALVTRECAAQAQARGKGRVVERPLCLDDRKRTEAQA